MQTNTRTVTQINTGKSRHINYPRDMQSTFPCVNSKYMNKSKTTIDLSSRSI